MDNFSPVPVVRPIYKLISLLSFMFDVLYPWVNWYFGGFGSGKISESSEVTGVGICSQNSVTPPSDITDDPETNHAFNAAVTLLTIMWSVSAFLTWYHACTPFDDTDDDDDTVVEFIVVHLVISVIATLLLVIDNALAGNFWYMTFTIILRFVILVCILSYYRDIRRARRGYACLRQFLMTKKTIQHTFDMSSSESEDEDDPMVAYLRYRRNKDMDSS